MNISVCCDFTVKTKAFELFSELLTITLKLFVLDVEVMIVDHSDDTWKYIFSLIDDVYSYSAMTLSHWM